MTTFLYVNTKKILIETIHNYNPRVILSMSVSMSTCFPDVGVEREGEREREGESEKEPDKWGEGDIT